MITLIFETANIIEAPPAKCGNDRRRCFLGPGTRALVHLTLHGPEGVSRPIGVSGATGEVFYDGLPTGDRAGGDIYAGAIYAVAEPFATGRRAGVQLSPAPPLSLSRVDKVVVGHDRQGAGPEWFLKSLSVQVGPDRSYAFACNRWLPGDDLELAAPVAVTPPPGPTLAPPVTPVTPPVTPAVPQGAFDSSAFNRASFV